MVVDGAKMNNLVQSSLSTNVTETHTPDTAGELYEYHVQDHQKGGTFGTSLDFAGTLCLAHTSTLLINLLMKQKQELAGPNSSKLTCKFTA